LLKVQRVFLDFLRYRSTQMNRLRGPAVGAITDAVKVSAGDGRAAGRVFLHNSI
jgi:hypothetical protein